MKRRTSKLNRLSLAFADHPYLIIFVPIVIACLSLLWHCVSLDFTSLKLDCIKPDYEKLGEFPFWATVAHITTCFSFLFICLTVYYNRKMADANFINRFECRYYSPEMLKYINMLTEFRHSNKKYFTRGRKPQFNPDSALDEHPFPRLRWSKELEEARRAVRSYFFTVFHLHQKKTISETAFVLIIDKAAMALLFDVIEPMDREQNPSYKYQIYRDIMEYCGDIYKRRVAGQIHLTYNRHLVIKTDICSTIMGSLPVVHSVLVSITLAAFGLFIIKKNSHSKCRHKGSYHTR